MTKSDNCSTPRALTRSQSMVTCVRNLTAKHWDWKFYLLIRKQIRDYLDYWKNEKKRNRSKQVPILSIVWFLLQQSKPLNCFRQCRVQKYEKNIHYRLITCILSSLKQNIYSITVANKQKINDNTKIPDVYINIGKNIYIQISARRFFPTILESVPWMPTT